jgi:sugar lactone lactonase YvrE
MSIAGDARPLTQGLLALLAVLGLFANGCKPASQQFSLSSRFFSSVEIIGSRGKISGQFNKPRSVVVDTNDNLYVVDMTGRVQKFAPDGTFLLSWQMPQTDKGKPKGMCLDSHGRIIVLEPHYSRVNHFAPDGHLMEQWGRHGTNTGDLAFPRAVAVNAAGDTFVSEYGLTERVQQFSAGGKQLLRVLGKAGAGVGEFNRPEGVGLDPNGCLYVADSCNHRIQVFSPDGKFLRAYGRPGSAQGQLSYPYDIRVDNAGNQFVCEFGNSRLQIFDAQDRPIETIGGPGTAPGQFSNPWSIAFDSHGNLYVADSLNHRVQKFIRRKHVTRCRLVSKA